MVIRRKNKHKTCLECGDALHRSRKLNSGVPTFLCSEKCRDFRLVKESLGEDQSMNARLPDGTRKGQFHAGWGALWVVAHAETVTGYTQSGTTTVIDVLLRRYNGPENRIKISTSE